MNKKQVSIVIVNWNRGNDLEEVLQSIDGQDFDNELLEVIIVDNASSDNSKSIISRYVKTHRNAKSIILPINLGCSSGCNVGFMNTSGKYVFNLDSDCILNTDSVSKMVNIFDSNPNCGIVSFNVQNYFTRKEQDSSSRIKNGDIYINAAVGIKNTLFKKIGYYSDYQFIYGEENDFMMRVYDTEYKVIYDDSLKVYHKEANPEQRAGGRKIFYNTRNTLYIIWRYFPLFKAVEQTAYHIIYNFLWSVKNRHVFAYLKGISSAIKNFKLIKQKRHIIKNWHRGEIYPMRFKNVLK